MQKSRCDLKVCITMNKKRRYPNYLHCLLKSFLLLFPIIFGAATFAKSQTEGQMTKYEYEHHECVMKSITTRWVLHQVQNDAVVSGSYKWEAADQDELVSRGPMTSEADSDDTKCLDYRDFMIIKVQSLQDCKAFGWITLRTSVPRAGEGYAVNVAQSVRWDRLICGYNERGYRIGCYGEEDAKRFWQQGFTVVDFRLIRRR